MLTVAALSALGGCVPLVVGGAMVGGALSATDRRTTGAQVEDQSIDLKAASRMRELFGERAHLSVNSYNRLVLITGEVPSEADRQAAEAAVARIDNVRSVVNESAVMGPSSTGSRSNDLLLASKVRASLVGAKDLMSNAFKVVPERGTIYLMGRVTPREAQRASEIARGVSGVTKVVQVFEIISEAELAELVPPSPKATGQSSPAPQP
jgi:osmotically-inducible protein OsmY